MYLKPISHCVCDNSIDNLQQTVIFPSNHPSVFITDVLQTRVKYSIFYANSSKDKRHHKQYIVSPSPIGDNDPFLSLGLRFIKSASLAFLLGSLMCTLYINYISFYKLQATVPHNVPTHNILMCCCNFCQPCLKFKLMK